MTHIQVWTESAGDHSDWYLNMLKIAAKTQVQRSGLITSNESPMENMWLFDESDEIQQKRRLRSNYRWREELQKQLKAENYLWKWAGDFSVIPKKSMTCICLSRSFEDRKTEKSMHIFYLALPMSYACWSEEWLLSGTLKAFVCLLSKAEKYSGFPFRFDPTLNHSSKYCE